MEQARDTSITFLDIIHRLAFYLKDDVLETGIYIFRWNILSYSEADKSVLVTGRGDP
jgi:hypothetical protein